jgi:hypothetical protein
LARVQTSKILFLEVHRLVGNFTNRALLLAVHDL